MTTPTWWSQPFPPTGAITSEGIRNQLGRPPVDPLTVFVRETAQNSWDARLPGKPTTYRLEISTVPPTHRPNWERLLAPPPHVQEHLTVGRAVRSPNLRLLSIVDRNTKGLGGPTRADEIAEDRRDWISFVLNVGEKRDRTQGGGTYGYGKAVLYQLSRVGTILVYTRPQEPGGEPASRLIGIALGPSFESTDRIDVEARPFTGRHWWGDARGEHVEPLLGGEADSAACSLGLAPFRANETGTTIVVIDPDLDEFDDSEAAAHLANTIAWQLWPIMLPERGAERLLPSVTVGGSNMEIPDPESAYPLKLFVAARRQLSTGRAEMLTCGNPRQDLGRFALERRVVVPIKRDGATQAAVYAGVDGDPHHVCLIRSPELVVKYYEGPVPSSVHQAYAGVFRAVEDLDDVYAGSEPPTHDNWVHEQLSGHDKTFVRVTFTRIRERLAAFRTPGPSATATTGGLALGAASSFLGGLVAAAFADPEDNVGRPVPQPSGRPARRSPQPRSRVQVTALTEPMVEEREGRAVLVQRLSVSGTGPVELSAKLAVSTWDGREDEPPEGAGEPRVYYWGTEAGPVGTESCTVDAPTEVELVVLPVPDTLTEIVVVVDPVGAM